MAIGSSRRSGSRRRFEYALPDRRLRVRQGTDTHHVRAPLAHRSRARPRSGLESLEEPAGAPERERCDRSPPRRHGRRDSRGRWSRTAAAAFRAGVVAPHHTQEECLKNLSGYISGSYSATNLDPEKVAAFEAAAQKLSEASAELGLSTTVSLTITEATPIEAPAE